MRCCIEYQAASYICDVQVQPKQSDVGVTGKLSKLSVRDSMNECENDGNDEVAQSDQPVNKKKSGNSRSRRRRKVRRGDAAAVTALTCEFVQGGGGKMHNSAASQRRDWFAVDATDKHTGPFDNLSSASDRRSGNDRDHRDSIDRKKTTPTNTVEGSSSRFDRPSTGAVTSQSKEPLRSIHSAASKFSDGSPSAGGRKSASKELSSGNRRQVASQRNVLSAYASDMQSSKAKTVTESGQTCVCC